MSQFKSAAVILTAIFASFFGFTDGQNCRTNVRALFIGFRHGAQSVAAFLPNDENNSKWTVGVGQLTPQGMRQLYKNGKLVHDRYAPLFDRYDSTKISARSTSLDRTLMSVSTFLSTLVPPNGNQIFKKGFNWQPAAVYTSRVVVADVSINLLTAAAQQAVPHVIETDPSTVNTLEKASGIEALKNPASFFILLDNIVTEVFAGFPLPYGLDSSLSPKIQVLKDVFFMEIFSDKTVRCLLAPPLLHDFIQKAEKTIRNETTQTVYILSMHDVNVFSLLSILNNYQSESPPFAATIFFEVRQLKNCEDYEVKFIYRKDLKSNYVQLKIVGCSEPCTLSEMKTIVETIENECDFNATSPQWTSCYE